MNVKEIAQAVNKSERSVQRWIQKAADKMSLSSPTNPSDYSLKILNELFTV